MSAIDFNSKDREILIYSLREGLSEDVADFLKTNQEIMTDFFEEISNGAVDIHVMSAVLRSDNDNHISECRKFISGCLDKGGDQLPIPRDEQTAPTIAPEPVIHEIQEVQNNKTKATPSVHQHTPSTGKSLRNIFSLRSLGTSLATTAVAGGFALYLSQNDETTQPSALQSFIQASENVAQVSSRFALAAYGQGQQAFASAEQYLEDISHAYAASQSVIQEQYSGSLYNPFIALRMADHPEYRDYIRTTTEAALTYGNLNPVWFTNQMYRECSQFDEDVINGTELSSAGAIGCAQFMPATAAEIGFTVEEMSDFETAINVSAYYMSELTDKHDGDQILAMIEYNGGAGAIDFIAENIEGELTGEAAMGFLQQRRANNPNGSRSAWHHETLGYVEVIVYGEETYDHRELARRQQLGGLPPNMIFAGALIAEQSGLISQQQRHILQTPLEGAHGPHIDLPTRPRPRPAHIARPTS